ncbi:hypothetical protein [Carnobacterium divergens]|nr:hypothetical protein [Carnobacterium divergens]
MTLNLNELSGNLTEILQNTKLLTNDFSSMASVATEIVTPFSQVKTALGEVA